jgi:hypothetical protein
MAEVAPLLWNILKAGTLGKSSCGENGVKQVRQCYEVFKLAKNVLLFIEKSGM